MHNDLIHDLLTNHIKTMSENDFQALGADGLAYIRPTGENNNVPTYAVHSADGSHIASGPDIAILQAIALQHNRVAVLLH
jgi:hypothetical protein